MSVTTVDFWVKSFDNTYLKCAKELVNSPKATIFDPAWISRAL